MNEKIKIQLDKYTVMINRDNITTLIDGPDFQQLTFTNESYRTIRSSVPPTEYVYFNDFTNTIKVYHKKAYEPQPPRVKDNPLFSLAEVVVNQYFK